MVGDDKYDLVLTQDRYPPQTGFVPFFRITFQELFQDSDFFYQGTKFHIKPKISKSILLMIYKHFLYRNLNSEYFVACYLRKFP